MDHLRIRCSSLPTIEQCPASLTLPAGGGRVNPSSAGAAALGNAGHLVMQRLVTTGFRGEDAALAAMASDHGCDRDALGALTWYGQEWWAEHGGQFDHVRTEQELATTFEDVTLVGHTDVLGVAGPKTTVIDWKFGYRTEVDVSSQLKGYCLLAFEELRPTEAQGVIVWLQDRTHQSWTWTHEELASWWADLYLRIVEAANTVEAAREYVPGEHCRYCPRIWTCPGQRALARSVMRDLTGASDEGWALTPAEAASLYVQAQDVGRLLDSYKDFIRRLVASEGPIPIPGSSQEIALLEWGRDEIDPLTAWPVMSKALDGDQEALARSVAVRKAALETEIRALAPRGAKKHIIEAFREDLAAAGAITHKRYEPKLVVQKRREALPETPNAGDPTDGTQTAATP